MNYVDGIPFDYAEINISSSMYSPSTLHCTNNTLVWFFVRYLMQDVMSVFDFTLPKEIDKRYFKSVLFYTGWIIGTYDNRFGAIAHYGTKEGYDFYRRPIKSVITLTHSEPVQTIQLERKLQGSEQDAVLIALQEDYGTILDLVMFYAERMALIYESFDTNIVNSKLAYVFGTDNKALAESFKKVYDNLAGGQTACVIDKEFFSDLDGVTPRWQAFFNNLKQNYIGSDLLIDLSKIRKEFCTAVGIPNANTDKKERATDDEINSNNIETLTRVEMWRDNINESLTRLGTIFSDWKGSEVRLRTTSNNIEGIIEGVSENTDFNESEV